VSAVDQVVSAEDPEGLLALGAPADEYRNEVLPLASLVLRDAVTSDAVFDVWEHWFGPQSALARSPERLARMTARLGELARRGESPS
jgi:hypothetical protein